MIGRLLCALGRHRFQPVFRHYAVTGKLTRSLERCWRLSGSWTCGAERYTDTEAEQWARGSQAK